ncbi:MAG TPA: 50S ribosomal protein L9, partial [Polyangia bacterium]|nr:50S ribosomal protein L9 [Polyangia bacterium]
IKATAGDIKRVEHEKRVIAARTAKLAKEAQSEADKLSQISVSIAVAVGEENRLYGSVTTRDVAEALKDRGVNVDPKKILLDEPLKALGLAEVPIKVGRGVNATVKVWVVKKED